MLVADDGPDAGADVWEVSGKVHGIDAVGEGAGEAGYCQARELGADGEDAAVRLGHFVLEGAFEARFDLFGVVVAQEAEGDDQAGHADEAA